MLPQIALHSRQMSTRATASGKLLIGLIPADGIGREVVPACRRVLEAVDAPFAFVDLDAGFELFQRTGEALPAKTVNALKNECAGSIFGAVSSPSHKVEGYSSPIVRMRKELDLYANVRPVQGTSKFGTKIDMVILRENTECLYVKQESIKTNPDGSRTATATRIITEKASTRIAELAFNMAIQRAESKQRKSLVTIVHKANVLSVTDGLFRESCLAVAKRFPGVRVEEQLVDSMVYRMFREPEVFDVIVAPNMYGDIISDGAAALVGSLGLVPSVNAGKNHYMAEPVHGSAPDIAGKGIANPVACILSGAMLLDALGFSSRARAVENAVDIVTNEKKIVTKDLGGSASTAQVTDAIIEHVKRLKW